MSELRGRELAAAAVAGGGGGKQHHASSLCMATGA